MPRKSVYSMTFSSIYPLLVAKAERKGRSREEVDAIISWVFGYDEDEIREMENSDIPYSSFLSSPCLNPKRLEKRGSVCGIKVHELEEGMERDMRILDLMIDELAKGKKLEKILMEEI